MMKEANVLNILMYLFKHHMRESCELEGHPQLLLKLEELGFRRKVIDQAFGWLSNLSQSTREPLQFPQQRSIRVFNHLECDVLSVECRGFLLTLEQQGILNPHTRELVINQALDLDPEGIDINLLKWVTLMVLFNQPNERHALSCMELLVLDDTIGGIH